MNSQRRKKYLVVGLGDTGYSCINHLVRKGCDIEVVDSRDLPPRLNDVRTNFPDIEVHTGSFGENLLVQADELVVSPGVSLKEPAIAKAIQAGTAVSGDVELFLREAKAPVIAITGSNGKSTVTTLVGEILSNAGKAVRVGGNIGVPALDLLQSEEPDVYVLELSSFQLESTQSINAAAAVILNITPDHMDRYSTLDEYAQAKIRIYQGTGVMVLNADDPLVAAIEVDGRDCVYFSLSEPKRETDMGVVIYKGEPWLAQGHDRIMPEKDVLLVGRHNVSNALAAIALVKFMNIPNSAIIKTLKEFRGLEHRTQVVARYQNVIWVNDSKATNVGATTAALEGLSQPVVLIAGGDGKGADFSEMADVVHRHVKRLLLIGRDGPVIGQAMGDCVGMETVKDMEEAVLRAHDIAEPGDIVLLSPACASFDMYKNYVERGKHFERCVRDLVAQTGGER